MVELTLSGNKKKADLKPLKWNVEGESSPPPKPLRGSPLTSGTVVELGPMEIRTFKLTLSGHRRPSSSQ